MNENEIPTPLPRSLTLEQERDSLFEKYLQGLQAIPASTLDLSPEEQQDLTHTERVQYEKDTAQLIKLQNQNDLKSTENRDAHLLARILEELLARHNFLSREWSDPSNDSKRHPKIVKTSPPDDLKGTDLVLSFSKNIACAVDITLLKEGSAREEKKSRRRKKHAKTFEQTYLSFWRFPDGSIGDKEFPFLLVHIPGREVANFVKTSAVNLAQPKRDVYQRQYKEFFASIMDIVAEEAEKMAKNMLDSALDQKYLSPELIHRIITITQRPWDTPHKALAIRNLTIKKTTQDETQNRYFDLLVQYYILYSVGELAANRLKKQLTKKQALQ